MQKGTASLHRKDLFWSVPLWKNPSGGHLMLCEHGCPESERMQNLLTICIPLLILSYLSSYLTKPFAVGLFLLRSRKSPAPSLSPHKFHLLVKNILASILISVPEQKNYL